MTTPTDTNPELHPLSDLTLERIALGELVGDELVAAHERLAAETGGIERLRSIERSNAAILNEYPPEVMVPRIERRIARAQREDADGAFSRGWWAGLSVGLAAAAAALAFAFVVPPADAPDSPVAAPVEVTRLKGLEPHVVVHRRTLDRSERLRPGERVSAGDVLQLSYVAGGEEFGAILSIDGAGVVTLHHPEYATLPPVLDGEGRVDLPYSYELDDAPSFERFVLVSSDAPLDVDAVLLAAKRLAADGDARDGDLDLPDDLHQSSILLEKGGRP